MQKKTPLLLLFFLFLALFACNRSVPIKPEQGLNRSVVIRFAGDVMFDRGIKRQLDQGIAPFQKVLFLTTNAHIMMVNLETTIATNGDKVKKDFNFMSHPSTLKWMTNAGINLVSIANNHSMDYGATAIRQTTHFLNQYGIRYAGAGMNELEASRGVILKTNGIKIGFLSFGNIYPLKLYAKKERPGIAGINLRKNLPLVKALKKKVDILIVALHWGWEYENIPRSYQPNISHAYIDNGADLIIGHHPHVLQPIEHYKQGFIFYSMGNFIFDQRKNINTRYTMIGELKISKSISNHQSKLQKEIAIYPLIKDYTDFMPRPLTVAEHKAWIKHFTSINNKMNHPIRLIHVSNSISYQYHVE